MTDHSTTPSGGRKDSEVIEDAVVVDTTVVDEATGTPVEVETVHATSTEPVIPTVDPAATATTPAPSERVVYVQLPQAPAKLSNRVFGTLVVLASTVLFTLVLAIVTAIIGVVTTGGSLSVRFMGDASFYIPTLFFFLAFLVIALLANRAAWWAYIVGSIVVALAVYFGTIGLGLLGTGIVTNTPEQASARFAAALLNPFIVVAAFLAREVSMWAGIAISRRGRRVKARNVEARSAYERELAEKRAEHDRGAAPAATAS